jgi:hypothetical protein
METPEKRAATDGRLADGAHCANVRGTFPDESFAVLHCSMA